MYEAVNIIEKKVSNTDAKKYLLNEKYDNLTKFIASPYFKIENISRYNNYYNNNKLKKAQNMRFFYLCCSNSYKYDLIIMKNRYLCQETITEILQYSNREINDGNS